MRAQIRGVELDYELTGTGDSFLWAHGLTSSRADEAVPPLLLDWDRLATAATAIRYDARGHGASGYTTAADGYGWGELARDQLALADHIGLDRFVLGGASMGAATALYTAVMAPDRVEALVLVIPPTGWESRTNQVGVYIQMAEIIERRGVELLVSAGATIPPPDPFVARPEWAERRATRMRAADPTRLAGVYRGAATTDLPAREAIATIGVPAIILAWSGDAAHPVSTAEALAELLPAAELVVSSTYDDYLTWTDRTIAFLG